MGGKRGLKTWGKFFCKIDEKLFKTRFWNVIRKLLLNEKKLNFSQIEKKVKT
jgi:hypothetical protein